jgi:hypothetical protein
VAGSELRVRSDVTHVVWFVAAFYLAWHYTGQAWGTVVSFGILTGVTLQPIEKLLIRAGLRVLLIWHVVWGAQDVPQYLGPLAPHLETIQLIVGVLAVTAFAAGVFGFLLASRRTGISIPLGMVVSWVAAYVWYIALYVDPAVFVLVQLSHALQYLPFPVRVEMNRRHSRGLSAGSGTAATYLAVSVLAGLCIFYLPETLTPTTERVYTIALLTVSLVSITTTSRTAWYGSGQTQKSAGTCSHTSGPQSVGSEWWRVHGNPPD